jgi:hypothetical protein
MERGHHDRVHAPGPLELRRGGDDASGRLEAWRGDEPVAALLESAGPTATSVSLLGRQIPIAEADVRALLDALIAHAPAGLELVTTDPLVRDVARRHGFAGPLRGPLAPGSSAVAGPAGLEDPTALRAAIQQLLPGIDVDIEARVGVTRGLFRRAASGVARTVNLFAAPTPQSPSVRFSVPNRADLLVESVARCIEMTIEIGRRCGRAASHVRRVSFDYSDSQLLSGHHAGSADRVSGTIHMNASLASIEGLTAMETRRAERGGGGSAGVLPPFNQIDGTTAHEMWHQMEGAIEGRHAIDGIELRRALGEALGVETLERAVDGGRASAPQAWQHARERLVEEVSPYAATAPVEATAEMFKLWWCGSGELSPIVRRFGELAGPLLAAYDAEA